MFLVKPTALSFVVKQNIPAKLKANDGSSIPQTLTPPRPWMEWQCINAFIQRSGWQKHIYPSQWMLSKTI